MDGKIVNEVRVTANTYSVLQELDEGSNKGKLCQKDIEEVENYAKLKLPPSFNVTGKWSQVKNGYFKECWERLHGKNKD